MEKKYRRERVDNESGDIHYEIHSCKDDDNTFIVFEGHKAREQSKLMLWALHTLPEREPK